MTDSFDTSDTDGWDDDDLLAAALADALAEDVAVPARVRELGRELFVWRDVDAELSRLAELEAGTTALVRDESRWQTLSFRASTVTVELDVDFDSASLRGQVVPAEGPPPSHLVVEGPSFDSVQIAVDEVGYFTAELGAPLLRFRLRVGPVVTPFVG